VIDSFNSSNDLHPTRVVLVNVLDQFGFRVGRTGDENCTGICHGLDDSLEIIVVFRCMSAADAIGLVMDVLCRMLRMHDKAFDIRRTEMENAGFPMIDPDDGMVVRAGHDFSSFAGRWRRMGRIEYPIYPA
jgi:hypothetical protein